MKRAVPVVLFLALLLPQAIQGKKIATFPDLLKPRGMVIENERLYITEETTVYVYSTQDYGLIKKFGKSGEGPGEFLRFVAITPHEDHLLINSIGKISIFTTDGEFVKEIKAAGGFSFFYQPLGKNYVGVGIGLEDNTRYESINLYDPDLKKIKTLLKRESDTQPNKGVIKLLHNTLRYLTFDNKLYVVNGHDFEIKVYDQDARELMTIRRDYQRVPFGQEDKERIFEEIKSDPRQKQYFDVIKRMAVFPEYYPAIVALFQRDDFIYVMTLKRQGDKYEFFVFDGNGNFLKKTFIPFVFQTAMNPYPFSIKDSKLYQLIENMDTEEWELHAADIK